MADVVEGHVAAVRADVKLVVDGWVAGINVAVQLMRVAVMLGHV